MREAPLGLPPGPRGHWLLGTWPQFSRGSLQCMESMVAEYGDAVRYRFVGRMHGYLFTHPDHLAHILLENNRNYVKRYSAYEMLRPMIGNGLLTNDGAPWLKQRRLMQPAFHRARVAGLGSVMTEAAVAMVGRWAAVADAGGTVDVDREMTRIAFEIAGKALFGHDLQAASGEALPAFTVVSREIAALLVHPLGMFATRMPLRPGTRRLRANVARLDRTVEQIVERRRSSGETGDDLLGMLLEARDEETGEGMTWPELRDEVMTLMFAGQETTAQAMTWTLHLLSQHPGVEARVRQELADALGGRTPAVEDLRSLSYTTMVIHEAMRLYPPIYAFPRIARAADEVGGYRVPAGAMLTLSPYLTHRHPAFWEDPERFDPQRFTPERSSARPRFAYVPFGGGPRQCIGNGFALTEAQLVLATVLQAYRLEGMLGRRVEPEPLIALRPRGGLPMKVRRAIALSPRACPVHCGRAAGGCPV